MDPKDQGTGEYEANERLAGDLEDDLVVPLKEDREEDASRGKDDKEESTAARG